MYSHCDGLEDWFNCLGCKHICTSSCPIESPDAIGGLSSLRSRTINSGFGPGGHLPGGIQPDDYIINDFDFNKGDA